MIFVIAHAKIAKIEIVPNAEKKKCKINGVKCTCDCEKCKKMIAFYLKVQEEENLQIFF